MVESAFDQMFPELFRSAYRVAYRLLGSREDAADCAQEACARACADWPKLTRAGSPVPWVVRVSSNLAIDRLATGERNEGAGSSSAVPVFDPDPERIDLVPRARSAPPPPTRRDGAAPPRRPVGSRGRRSARLLGRNREVERLSSAGRTARRAHDRGGTIVKPQDLDDRAPIEPGDELLASVHARSRSFRRRRSTQRLASVTTGLLVLALAGGIAWTRIDTTNGRRVRPGPVATSTTTLPSLTQDDDHRASGDRCRSPVTTARSPSHRSLNHT